MTSTWLPPAPGWPSGTSATSGASWVIGLSVPSMKPMRSRESRCTKAGWSVASTATSARAWTAARACSNTTSRELPLIHSQKSCWVAGARWPPTALMGVNGRISSGACSGAMARQRSLPNPATRLTPPAATAGARRRLSAAVATVICTSGRRSNSMNS